VPLKAAAAIDKVLRQGITPLRLQLGKDAIDAIRQHSEALLNDMTAWKTLGEDTDF